MLAADKAIMHTVALAIEIRLGKQAQAQLN